MTRRALTLSLMMLGELAPKRIAMQRASGWAMFAAWPLHGLAVAASRVPGFILY